MGGSGAPTEAVSPGRPVTLSVPPGATGLRVARPDGTTTDLAPGTAGGQSVTFSEMDQLGVYTVTALGLSASPSPSIASASASASTGPTAGLSEPAGSSPPVVDANGPVRFAVNLFDVDESRIAPGDATKITALGSSATAAGSPGASGGQAGSGGAAAADRPAARDELWVPVLLAVLAFLCVEWAVYQRDALIRFARTARARVTNNARHPADGG
jgi:hypothetical protein